MKGYEAVAAALAAEGVDTVFGLIGGGADSLAFAMAENQGMRYISPRHEQAAVGMADGYARASGRIGVALTTYGPGLTNTATMLTLAHKARSPVLLVCADPGPGQRFNVQVIDQPMFIRSTGAAVQPVGTPRTLSTDVELAFRHLRLGHGPVVLTVGTDVGTMQEPADWCYAPTGLSRPTAPQSAPDADAIDRACALIATSERPLVLAGRGAFGSGAERQIADLADRIGALLVTTLPAQGLFRGHPFLVGYSGAFAAADQRAILQEADLVLAFGAQLNQHTMDHGTLYRSARIVQVDSVSDRIGEITPVHLGVLGDAATTARLLAEGARVSPRRQWRGPEMAERIRALNRWAGIDCADPPGYVNPYAAIRLLDEQLPADRAVVVDVSMYCAIPAAHMRVREPNAFILPWEYMAVGSGLPIALGAAVARPDRPMVLFAGDGGLMMTLADLDTAARFGIPLIVVVMNDAGFGAERRIYRLTERDPWLAEYRSPDFAGAAGALGLEAHVITEQAALRTVLQRGLPPDRPVLLDLRLAPEAPSLEWARAMPSPHLPTNPR